MAQYDNFPRIRSSDVPEAKEYTKRQIPMAIDSTHSVVIDGWIGRVLAFVSIANKLSVAAVLLGLVIVFGLIMLGKIDIPLYTKIDQMIKTDALMTQQLIDTAREVRDTHDIIQSLRDVMITTWRVECENLALNRKNDEGFRNCQSIRIIK